MWEKIVAFFMSIIAFFANLFGIGGVPMKNSVAYLNCAYGSESRQVMDLYIPEDYTGDGGLMLFIHGGAWVAGDKESYGSTARDVCQNYGSNGIAAATINYRYLSEKVTMNDILDDIDAALSKIKAIGEENGMNINKVILGGSSAGGHLSMLYAYARKDTAPITPVAVADFCGPTDMLDENFMSSELGQDNILLLMSWAIGKTVTKDTVYNFKGELKAISPLYYVDENTVPTIINHGKKDTVVPFSNAESLKKAFDENGVTYIFNPYPNSGHDLSSDDECEDYAYDMLVEYVWEYLV